MARFLVLGVVLAASVAVCGCRSAPLGGAGGVCAPAPAGPCCDPLLVRGGGHECGEMYFGAGLSLLPNVGGVLEGGYVFDRSHLGLWSFEVQGTWQPIDDKTFIDDGGPEAGDWWEARAGVKLATDPDARRHLTFGAGGVWFRANGEPNWVDTPGTYYGAYGSFGFETDFTPEVTIGPSFTLMAAWHSRGDEFDLVPNLQWTVTLWPGRRDFCDPRCVQQDWCNPPGEIYLDGFVTASAGIGGGAGGGQVFARKPGHVASFEVSAAFEGVSDDLFGNGDGDLAQLFGGVKLSFWPGARSHPVLRAGATWLRTTAPVEWLDEPGDYLGAYVSGGWEFDLSRRFTTGPELGVGIVTQEGGNVNVELVPRLSWHLVFKF